MLIPDGPDYTSSLLTAVFRGNSTAIVPVPTLPENIVEGEESFTAVILVPVEATMAYRVTRGSPATATVVIIDNDSKFSAKCTYLNYLATRLQFTRCLAVSIAPSTDPPTDPSTEVNVIVATVVVVLVVMTTTVAIVIAVAVFCRKRSKCR